MLELILSVAVYGLFILWGFYLGWLKIGPKNIWILPWEFVPLIIVSLIWWHYFPPVYSAYTPVIILVCEVIGTIVGFVIRRK